MKILLTLTLLVLLSPHFLIACNGGTASGALAPAAAYQTVNTQNGRYYTVNVNQCSSYEFTFCAGGSVSGIDSQLTILDATGVTEIVTTDDVCGVNAAITWVATFTGTIRILISRFSCNNDLASNVTMAYRMTAIPCGPFSLAGNATNQVIGGQNCIELTPELNAQTGCAWNNTVLNFSNPFNLSLNYYFGNNINGADGTTFTFQPNPAACGTAGGQLGAGGIPNSLIIEFDTYDNDNPAHIFDLPQDHISVEIDGNLLGPAAPYCGPTPAFASGANLDDGVTHAITINWNPATFNLTIYVDGSLRLTCNGNFVTSVFGGDNTVYWGATAATGGLNNQQYFCPSSVALPIKISDFHTECDGKKEQISWISESENELQKYTLEKSFDGQVFTPVYEVPVYENSTSKKVYSFENKEQTDKQVYYRFFMTNKNGTIEYTDIIASKNCSVLNQDLFHSFQNTDNSLDFNFNKEDVYYQLYDLTGKAVSTIIYSSEKNSTFDSKISSGMYLIYVWNNLNTQKECHSIYVK